eukprot:3086679-Pleurochrysis_carterae.AAC.6
MWRRSNIARVCEYAAGITKDNEAHAFTGRPTALLTILEAAILQSMRSELIQFAIFTILRSSPSRLDAQPFRFPCARCRRKPPFRCVCASVRRRC